LVLVRRSFGDRVLVWRTLCETLFAVLSILIFLSTSFGEEKASQNLAKPGDTAVGCVKGISKGAAVASLNRILFGENPFKDDSYLWLPYIHINNGEILPGNANGSWLSRRYDDGYRYVQKVFVTKSEKAFTLDALVSTPSFTEDRLSDGGVEHLVCVTLRQRDPKTKD
jgi:hypothetical protein